MTPKPLRDIPSAEKLHTKALPKTAHAAFKRELSASLASHLEKTVDDIERLDRLVEACGNKLKRMKCDAMNGPREEGEDLMAEDLITEDTASPPRVAVPVGPAHKARHYETTTYGTLAAFASHLDHPEAVELLKKTLVEEQASDRNPTGLAEENANPEADPAPGEAAASGESDSAPEPGSGHPL
jgi:ferritin-like metal-binding protein YciE